MSRIKLTLLSMLAVFAISAAVASTASASWVQTTTECTEEPGKLPTFCIELPGSPGKLWEAEGSEKFSSKLAAGAEKTLLEAPEAGVHIECTTATNTLEIHQPTPLTAIPTVLLLTLVFNGCTVLPTLGNKCEVNTPIEVKPSLGTTTDVMPVGGVLFEPENATKEFAQITFKSKVGQVCPATLTAQPVKVTGTVLCAMTEPEVDLVKHILVCKHEATNTEDVLLFAEGPATFEIEEEFEMSGGQKGEKFDLVLG